LFGAKAVLFCIRMSAILERTERYASAISHAFHATEDEPPPKKGPHV
jgi:hypothetical protein